MKKLYFLFFLVLFTCNAFAQSSTTWLPADSAKNVVKPGSGSGNPVWGISNLPLMHNGVSYLTSSTLWGGGNNIVMDHAYYYDFNVAIPTTATITGVQVIVSRFGCNGGNHSEDTISLACNGVPIGTYVADTMPASGSTDTFGSSTNMWGASLTPAMVNSNSFGVYYDIRSVGVCTIALQDLRIKVHYQTTMGINGVAETKAISVHPNPAKHAINLETTSTEKYIITDCLGRVMLTGNTLPTETRIDISSLANGLYYIKAGNEVTKFVKN